MVVEILEHATIKILGVVNCDLLRNSVMANDVMLEIFLYGCRGYIGDRLRLDPLGVSLRMMSMPHCCRGQDGVINCEGWVGYLER
jgi:hypothetical protein